MYTYEKAGPHFQILKNGRPICLFVSESDAAKNCDRMNNPTFVVIRARINVNDRFQRERDAEATRLRHLIDGGL